MAAGPPVQIGLLIYSSRHNGVGAGAFSAYIMQPVHGPFSTFVNRQSAPIIPRRDSESPYCLPWSGCLAKRQRDSCSFPARPLSPRKVLGDYQPFRRSGNVGHSRSRLITRGYSRRMVINERERESHDAGLHCFGAAFYPSRGQISRCEMGRAGSFAWRLQLSRTGRAMHLGNYGNFCRVVIRRGWKTRFRLITSVRPLRPSTLFLVIVFSNEQGDARILASAPLCTEFLLQLSRSFPF